jgi:hypothetical protein
MLAKVTANLLTSARPAEKSGNIPTKDNIIKIKSNVAYYFEVLDK